MYNRVIGIDKMRICILLFCFVIYNIVYSSIIDEFGNGINKAQKNTFELIIDKNNPQKPINIRFLSDKKDEFQICKSNLEIFPQIKFYITKLVDGKEECIFACNSFSNKAIQPTSKLENITISKGSLLYNQKFASRFFNFLKDVIVDNDLNFEKIKEFKVVIGLRNIFVDDSQPPEEVFTVYYETVLDKSTLMYFFDIINKK